MSSDGRDQFEPFSSLFHPDWGESEAQLTEKQAVLLMHDIYNIQECKWISPGCSGSVSNICRAMMWPPRPLSTAECLHLIACLRGEQASAASWEPWPPFEATEMD